MRSTHSIETISVSVVPAPRWIRTPLIALQETATWQVADLREYVTGEPPFTFEADDLPAGLTLLPTGELVADGAQVEGDYTVTFRAQNSAIAPLWVPALPSSVTVVPAPIAPQGSTLVGKYGLSVTIGIGIGTSFNASGFP